LSEPEAGRSYAAGIARGASVIAVITIFSRVIGLARTLTFSQTVGATCLGTAYVTANQIPNLVYELVLGGALSSVMVPLLARPAERSATDSAGRDQVNRTTSALLTWCVLILVPLTLIIVVVAGPVAELLNPVNHSADCVHSQVVSTTASMLRIFAPQALLYGLSVVLLGVLQSYRRFAAYALAPLINSLVVIASLLAFTPLAKGAPLGRVPAFAELVLAAGATLGVAAMVVVALVPTWRLRVRLRPTLRLPSGIGRRAGGLALVGIVEMVATEISAVVSIALANGRGATGALVLVSYASQVFATVNAVLALSISTSAFPVLSARDGSVFDRACAGSTRAVVLVSSLGVAVIAAVALPAAHVLAGHGQVSQLALGMACFAPGLVGLGVLVNLSRAMLAIGRLKIAAAALAGSTLVALAAQVILVEIVPAHLVVAALATGNTVGVTVVAIPIVIVTRRVLGPASVQGVGRATLVGLAAAAGAGLVGFGVSLALPMHHKLIAIGVGALAAACAAVVFCVIALRLDDGDLRLIMARFSQAAGLRSGGQSGGRPVGPGALSALVSRARQRASEKLRMRDRGRMVRMSFAENKDQDQAGQRRPGLLTPRERQSAIAIGVIAGAAGGYAVFATSNEAGTVVLLLIALVFLLVGVEGTPLLWHVVKSGTHQAGKRRLDKTAQRAEPRSPQLGAGLADDIAMSDSMLITRPPVAPAGVDEPLMATRPAITQAPADDGSSIFPADERGGIFPADDGGSIFPASDRSSLFPAEGGNGLYQAE
jgi:putative peptidoglycan lipid II flippase